MEGYCRILCVIVIGGLVGGMGISSSRAQSGGGDTLWKRCMAAHPDVVIGACTQIIRSGANAQNISRALTNHCGAYTNMGQFSNSYRDCDEAIRLDQNNGAAYLNRGIARYRDKSLPQAQMFPLALADLDNAVRLSPKNSGSWYNRGVLYFLMAQQPGQSRLFDAAIGEFHQAIKLKPQHGLIWYGRSRAKARKGDAAGARADEARARALGYGKKS